MTSERLINAIAGFLRPKVEAAGGVFALSETVAHTLGLLSGGAGKFRVILQWQREAATGNRGEREMIFLVIVQQGVTLGVNPGDAVTVQRPASMLETTQADSSTSSLNNAPLMQRCTEVCRWTRSIKFSNADLQQWMPSCVPGNAYWLNDPSFPTKQIAHEFAIRFANDSTASEAVNVE